MRSSIKPMQATVNTTDCDAALTLSAMLFTEQCTMSTRKRVVGKNPPLKHKGTTAMLFTAAQK